MQRSQPLLKFEFAERAASRYRDDVELWRADRDAGASDPWPLQELVEIANRAFEKFNALDAEIRRSSRAGKISDEDYERLDSKIESFFERWLAASRVLKPEIERLQSTQKRAGGAAAFLAHVREVEAMLASDDEFFDHEEIANLRDAAIAAFKRGDVEPMFDDAPRQSRRFDYSKPRP